MYIFIGSVLRNDLMYFGDRSYDVIRPNRQDFFSTHFLSPGGPVSGPVSRRKIVSAVIPFHYAFAQRIL